MPLPKENVYVIRTPERFMAKVNDLKNENIRDVRACFYRGGPWTKNELSTETGLSLAGTTNVLKYLLETGEILLNGKSGSGIGRKSKQYVLNPDHAHIGILIVRYNRKCNELIASSSDLFGKTVFKEILQDRECGCGFVKKTIASMLEKDPLIQILCVSIPGVCEKGVLRTCDVEALENEDLGSRIREEFRLPYVIENDVNSACIGFAHVYPDRKNMAVIFQPEAELSGCGIIIGGELYNGACHMAGEIKYAGIKGVKNPLKLLKRQIETLCAVLNPEIIGWYSEQIREETIGPDSLDLPEALRCPLERITDFFGMIEKGLYSIGIRNLTGKN